MFSRARRGFSGRFAVRTTLWFTGLLALGVAAASVSVWAGLRHNLYRDADEYLEGDIREFVYHLTEAGWEEPLLKAELLRGARSRHGQGVFYRLYETDGRELWTVPEGLSGRLAAPAEALRTVLGRRRRTSFILSSAGEADYLCLVHPVPQRGDVVRACQVGLSLEETEGRLTKYAYVLGGIGAAVVVAGAAACYLIVKRPLRAVREMSGRAREITATELHRRLPRPGTGDELDDLSETLNAMLERLDDSVRRLSQFTGDAAHELRGPLTRMRMAAEVSLQCKRSEAELRETLEEIAEQAGEMGRLVGNLLFLAQQDAGAAMGEAESIECRGVIEEAADIYEAVAEEKGVALRIGAVAGGTVRANRMRLVEALGNLVENAVKFTEAGGRVELAGTAEGEMYGFVVRDTGCGIAAADLPRIFDRFYRADRARSPGVAGAGLGLSIVQAIVTAHGGRVEVESEPGRGSIFRAVLPIENASGPARGRDG